MRIAVTYENGNVFPHFGKTESFKLYEVEDGKVLSSEEIGTDGAGHEALAGVLAEKKVGVLICGGMGDGAANALAQEGIEVISGAEGNTDDVVERFLNGTLTSAGVNCDHHDHEEEESSCGSGCGGGCSGCGGGCGGHSYPILFEGPNAGKMCRVNYRGTFDNGEQFDSSYDRGQTLDFVCGVGMMIKGFDKAVVNMKVGEKIKIHLTPEEAYGNRNPENVFECAIRDLQGSEELEVGEQVFLYDANGRPVRATVISRDEVSITFDMNHEMAGKELNFEIELVEVKEN